MIYILCFEQNNCDFKPTQKLNSIENVKIDCVHSTFDLKNQLILNEYDLLMFIRSQNEIETSEILDIRKLFPLKIIDVLLENSFQNIERLIKTSIEEDFHLELKSVMARFAVLGEVMDRKSIIEFSKMFPARLEKYVETVHAAILKKNKNELSFQMHTLKSLSANVGGIKLPKLCEYVEYQKANDFDFEIPVYVNCIFRKYKILNEVLKSAEELYQQ